MLLLGVLVFFNLSAGAFAFTATPESGGPFVISNVHTGLAIDLLDKDMQDTTPLVVKYQAECLSVSQLWYTGPWGADGATIMGNAHYPGKDVLVIAEGDRLLASTAPADTAAPLFFQNLPGNVTVITIGGLAVTSGKGPGEELKLAPPRAHDKRQQWRFTLVG